MRLLFYTWIFLASSLLEARKKASATETRTQVTCVKGKYANHLHHSGSVTSKG